MDTAPLLAEGVAVVASTDPAAGVQTDILGDMISLIGPDATLKIVEKWGGTRHRIPTFKGKPNAIETLVGKVACDALIERFGGAALKIPQAHRWRARVYRERGKPYPYIARKLGRSETTIWRWLNDMGLTNTSTAERQKPGLRAAAARRRRERRPKKMLA